jgi:hypothetical protein
MESSINQKSQELCFALLRVAAHIRRFELRRTIERLSYHLLENISYQNPEMALSTIDALRNFVVLGKNIYEIEINNARILDRELEQLANAFRQSTGLSALPDLESFFTKSILVRKAHEKKTTIAPRIAPRETPSEVIVSESEVEEAISQIKKSGNQESGNEDSLIRQNKIEELLRSSASNRLALKDFIAAFPEVSERTIRNDLRRLFERGRITRQGSGGPANYYTLSANGGQGGVINLPPASL